MDDLSPASFAVVAAAAVLAPILAELLRRFRVPSVVLEIALGIVIGPEVLGWANIAPFISALSDFGLAFLMFLAGYEINFVRVRGTPINRAVVCWLTSLVFGLAIAAVLTFDGYQISDLLVGLVLTTTSMGALLPILHDANVLSRPFGTFTLAAGAIGEFGPIVAITLLLAGDNPWTEAVWLGAFVGVALILAFFATRPQPLRIDELIARHLSTSSQLPVRVAIALLAAMLFFAHEFGLEGLLGSFTAGLLFRPLLTARQREQMEPRLHAIGYGFVIPVFFVVTGMRFDLDAVTGSVGTMLRIPLFLALFLVVRGAPALVFYRGLLSRAHRRALAFMQATALPLVVVITEIGRQTGRMSSSDAASLCAAAMLSVLIFPVIGLGQLRGGEKRELAPERGEERQLAAD
jgi:Kef-type K+ transport system membrane component KefB